MEKKATHPDEALREAWGLCPRREYIGRVGRNSSHRLLYGVDHLHPHVDLGLTW